MPLAVTCPACQANLKVPDAFAGRKVKCPKCAQQMIVETAAPTADVVADETDDERDDEPVRRTKKKRKKKRRSKPNNAWIWLIGVGGSVVMLGLIAFLMVMFGANLIYYAVVLAISVPVSMVILLISIYISNALGIGLDFGDAKIAIPKMILLLVMANLVSLVPFAGGIFALLVWLCGLMALFELDLWEARFLIGINIILNLLFKFLLLAAILHAMKLGLEVPNIMDQPDEEEDRVKTPWDQGGIEDFGGKSGVELPRNVFFIRLGGTGFRDGDFPRLAKFYDRVEELNLSHCDVSDKGLKYIKNFTKLKALILNGTRVTEKGVKELQKKMPNLKIVWEPDKTPMDDNPDKDD
jgi:predicted Zn finger-like uncharacterized protein